MRKHLPGIVRQSSADGDNGDTVFTGKPGDSRRGLAECRLEIHPALAGKYQVGRAQMGLYGGCPADDLNTAPKLRSRKHEQSGAQSACRTGSWNCIHVNTRFPLNHARKMFHIVIQQLHHVRIGAFLRRKYAGCTVFPGQGVVNVAGDQDPGLIQFRVPVLQVHGLNLLQHTTGPVLADNTAVPGAKHHSQSLGHAHAGVVGG